MTNEILSYFDQVLSDKCWIGKYGRLAITGKQHVGNGYKKFPVSCSIDVNCENLNEHLTDLIPDDSKTGVAFWKYVTPTSYRSLPNVSSARKLKHAETTLEFVVWVNLKKTTGNNNSESWCTDPGAILKDAIRTIDCKNGVIQTGSTAIKNLKIQIIEIGNTDTWKRAMSEYSINNIEALTMWPFAAFTLKVKLSYIVASHCVGDYFCFTELDCSDMAQLIFRTKVTKTYADFAAAATTNDIEIFSLPPKAHIWWVAYMSTDGFAGGGISFYSVGIGITGNLNKYKSAQSVGTVMSVPVFGLAPGSTSTHPVESMTAATSIRAAATSTNGNLDQATAGSINIWIYYSILD